MYNEFSLIKKIKARIETLNRNHPALIVPPGDDAALLSTITRPVITTDCHREGVHFKLDWQTPCEIGYKAAVVCLSDLAAAYATPVCLFINLGLPDSCNEIKVMELYDGIVLALNHYPCGLGGGNIAASPELSLDLFAIGEGHPDMFPLRSNAREGDGLYVTVPLGLARAGLNALEQGRCGFSGLIDRFKKPEARFDAARILCENKVSCLMDISDGLSGDAAHIASASNISIRLNLDENKLSPELIRYCTRFGLSPMDMALAGGEDYELLFTCSADVFERINQSLPHAFKVGDCLPYAGQWVLNPPKSQSFAHGAGH